MLSDKLHSGGRRETERNPRFDTIKGIDGPMGPFIPFLLVRFLWAQICMANLQPFLNIQLKILGRGERERDGDEWRQGRPVSIGMKNICVERGWTLAPISRRRPCSAPEAVIPLAPRSRGGLLSCGGRSICFVLPL